MFNCHSGIVATRFAFKSSGPTAYFSDNLVAFFVTAFNRFQFLHHTKVRLISQIIIFSDFSESFG